VLPGAAYNRFSLHQRTDGGRSRMHPRSTHTRRWRALLALAAVLAAGGALAACGSSSPTSTVAAVGSSTATTSTAAPAAGGSGTPSAADNAKLVKFSQCMRSHGVPDFPDPTGGRLLLQSKKGSSGSLHPDSPQFKAASQACKSLSPAGLGSGQTVSPQVQAQALKFARCMRSHGVPSFPDPSFTGGGIRIQAPGTNLSSPAFKRAQQECGSLLPGGAP
jgi:hypothetical protein